eukprot:CAMPEP_0185440002 /NCGR_PEP_ID=MMETSP1365-20130426/38886_1 /TAXON_ID=38817 /ORGANISM="Gephyrocapsa oceanica, Strain RCC1303" /LENGTH=30 /DNA_ID= /DNA_START= /DNA_END= /DNA_ORIENTATION=
MCHSTSAEVQNRRQEAHAASSEGLGAGTRG